MFKVGDRVITKKSIYKDDSDLVTGTVVIDDEYWIDERYRDKIRYTILIDEEYSDAWFISMFVGDETKIDEKYRGEGKRYTYKLEEELELVDEGVRDIKYGLMLTSEEIKYLTEAINCFRDIEDRYNTDKKYVANREKTALGVLEQINRVRSIVTFKGVK